MNAVVLMPSFGSCPYRDGNQAFVLEHYRSRWGLPVVLGRDDFRGGFYARTRAINAAAREAVKAHPEADVFVLCDNDLLPDERTFQAALNEVGNYAAVAPHSLTLLTTKVGRLQFLKHGVRRNFSTTESGSRSFVVLRKEVFDAVNGMDELFVGWGPEDKAFLESVKKQAGDVLHLDGQRFHLWHPYDPSRFNRGALQQARDRFHTYVVSSPEQVRVLARQYGAWNRPGPVEPAAQPAEPPRSPPPGVRRKFDHAVGLRNVHDMLVILSENGVRSWVQDGTLLGLVRDGKLIDYDHDTDTGAMIDDLTPAAVEALERAGFKLSRVLGAVENGLQHRWTRDGVKTDIFWYYVEGERWWHAAYVGEKKQFRFYYGPFSTAPIHTDAGPMPAPDPPEEFLETKYGADWRTPRQKWHFAKDPKNAREM